MHSAYFKKATFNSVSKIIYLMYCKIDTGIRARSRTFFDQTKLVVDPNTSL